jgi:putative ABC transport system substrate-binding protein
MQRREFITLIGSAVACPRAARAHQAPQPPTIGFFSPTAASVQMEWTAAFTERLREHGWIEGSTVRTEYRWADGRVERLPEIAAEFVRLKVKVIVAGGSLATATAKQATGIIPIVICPTGDAVGTGLVASLAHPGTNVHPTACTAAASSRSARHPSAAGRRTERLPRSPGRTAGSTGRAVTSRR